MKQLSVEEYVAKGGSLCPFCGSDNIEGYSVEIDGNTAWQDIGCNECDNEWRDVYKLDRFEE